MTTEEILRDIEPLIKLVGGKKNAQKICADMMTIWTYSLSLVLHHLLLLCYVSKFDIHKPNSSSIQQTMIEWKLVKYN